MLNAEMDVRLERIIKDRTQQLEREIAQLFGHEPAADPVEMLSIDEQIALLKAARAEWMSSVRRVVMESARTAGEEWAVEHWGKIGSQYCPVNAAAPAASAEA